MIRDGVFFLRAFALVSICVALRCLWASLNGGVPMPPETHGSAMHTVPAEVWSLVSLGQATAFFWLAGTRKYLALAGAAGLGAFINLALAIFSSRAEFGFIQSSVTGGIGIMHCVICLAALVDAVGCRLLARARSLIHASEDP